MNLHARQALQTSITPNPLFIRRGFRPLPNPSPIFGKELKQKVAEADDFLRLFSMAGHAMIFTPTTLNACRFFE